MLQNDTLNHIIALTQARKLGKAILEIENYLLAYPHQMDMDVLMGIKEDYKLMAEYWQRGYDDPHRQEVYGQLLQRTYALVANMLIHWQLRSSSFLHSLYLRPRRIRKDWSMTTVRRAMESYVADLALLELEPEQNRKQKREEIETSHQQLMHDLFDYILTSRLWKDSLADVFEDILLSPTLDSRDQQLIVSAITLSAMQTFGFNKFRVLANVYRNTTDERVRQRALVGWVLCANGHMTAIYPDVQTIVTELCQDEDCQKALVELQLQLFYCMDAEDDTRTIQEEIMPDLINGSNIKVTKQGLVELEEDQLEDMLHPEAAERNMERMEQSMHKMMDMHKQGADIYFGGFSQMKRFPFFNDISNWFVPFYTDHPAVSSIWQQARGKKFLQTITRIGAFCDSDKYSFVLAFNKVYSGLPPSMQQMIEQGEASPMPLGGEVDMEEQRQPAFIRRMYLQDLYRFFRLYSARSEFMSPFDKESEAYALFMRHPLYRQTGLSTHFLEVVGFLLKRHHYEQAMNVLANCPKEQQGYQYYMMMGTVLQHLPETSFISSLQCYSKALELKPDSERALVGFARASFRQHGYESALNAYEKLMEKQPENRSYMLNAAICMTHVGRNEEALKLLFKLNYLNPDDEGVSRVQAWAQTLAGRYEQADKLYNQLLSSEHPQPVDMLNYGYSLWFSGEVMTAVGMFRQFLNSQSGTFDMETEFCQTEYAQLVAHNISDVEIQLMLDTLQV